MQGKSRLNADAVPFTPQNYLPRVNDNFAKKTAVPPEKSEVVGQASVYQLPDTASFEESLENLHISEKPFADMDHSSSSARKALYDETYPADELRMSCDASYMTEFLLSRFPGYSAESLRDFLNMNDGDLDDTMDLLEQLEEFAPEEEEPEAFGKSGSIGPSSSR